MENTEKQGGDHQSELIKALSAQIWMATAVLMSGVWSASGNRWGLILAGVWIIVAGYWYKIGKRVGT